MKENFLNLTKVIDFQEVHKAQRVPKKLDPKRNTQRHITIKLPIIKLKIRRESEKQQEKRRQLPTKEFP